MNPHLTIKAKRLCDSFLAQQKNNSSFSVHSLFHHACNLITADGTLLTLQSCNSPLAPAGAILDCADLRPLFVQGELIDVQLGRLISAKVEIQLEGAKVESSQLDQQPSHEDLELLSEKLRLFLPQDPPELGLWLMANNEQLLSANLANLKSWLQSGEGDIAPMARKLIGLGAGLTPSGDDFILGILLVLEASNFPRRDQFISAVMPLLNRTTDISAAMLKNGCQGRYGEQLLRLIGARPGEQENQIAAVKAYGHSSGHDMLFGIAFALNALG